MAKGSGERSAARAAIFNCAMLRFKLSNPGLKGMELQDALQLLVVGHVLVPFASTHRSTGFAP
ncbi:hypothetical protein [Mesorhizobium sp.]|uniref:hypothetical protein n=1 Tax=Mesorhizobium sp. TaxID=1871066 RepID=UPI0025805542|nr:hypothetical protein [Mesorhizobium sp.]